MTISFILTKKALSKNKNQLNWPMKIEKYQGKRL